MTAWWERLELELESLEARHIADWGDLAWNFSIYGDSRWPGWRSTWRYW